MTQAKRTLYANKTHDRFFYIPQDTELLDGDFVIGTLTGQLQKVTEDSVTEFEVDEALAKDIASGVVKDVAQTAGRFMTSAADLLRSMSTGDIPKADTERREKRESNVAEFLGITKDQLRNDPQAVLDGIKGIGKGLKAALEQSISDNPVTQEGARARMEAFAEYAREDLGIKLGDNLADLPQQLADVLRNPELEASVRASTERLRHLSSQIRSASATVEEMEASAAAEDASDEV
jgi:hypothetical protein